MFISGCDSSHEGWAPEEAGPALRGGAWVPLILDGFKVADLVIGILLSLVYKVGL